MNSVCSTLPCSIEYVPSPADYLFNLRVEDKTLEIEDGLCSPNNQEVFLTASMAFLQTQLIRKLRNDIRTRFENKFYLPRKTYSDLLLVESQSKFRRKKYFIRVKNVEQYDEILKNEASTPRQTLSLNQILPAPKKTLWLNTANIFRTKSSKISLGQNSQTGKTFSFFENLKKSLFRSKRSSPLITEDPPNLNDVNLRCQLYVNALPSRTSISTLNTLKNLTKGSSSSSIAINRMKMAPSFVNPWKVTFDDDSSSTLPASTLETSSIISGRVKSDLDSSQSLNLKGHKNLSETGSELAISDVLSGPLKQSLSETIREIKNHYSYIHRIYNTRDVPSCETFESSSTVNVLARCSAQTTLKPQQSKMSVFLEEDSWSDEDEEIINYTSMCTNFTDEFKSRFSSEYLPSLFPPRRGRNDE